MRASERAGKAKLCGRAGELFLSTLGPRMVRCVPRPLLCPWLCCIYVQVFLSLSHGWLIYACVSGVGYYVHGVLIVLAFWPQFVALCICYYLLRFVLFLIRFVLFRLCA